MPGMEHIGEHDEFYPACRDVLIDQLGGRVEVTGWPERRIRLVSRLRGTPGQLRAITSVQGGCLKVAVDRVYRTCWPASAQIDLELWVPRETNVTVDAGSGPVRVRGIRGRLRVDVGSGEILVEEAEGNFELETGSGDVTLRAVSGRSRVETGSGAVVVEGFRGSLTGETGSGEVSIARLRGDLELETGSGSVVIRQLSGTRVSVETSSGDLRIHGLPLEGARWQLETGSGDVELALPETAACAVEVETGSGPIECRLPLDRREAGRRRLMGILNRPDGMIRVSTGSGSVALLPLAGGEFVPPEEISDFPEASDDASLSVLRMVEEGKISPAEAEALLEALSDAPPPAEEATVSGPQTPEQEPPVAEPPAAVEPAPDADATPTGEEEEDRDGV